MNEDNPSDTPMSPEEMKIRLNNLLKGSAELRDRALSQERLMNGREDESNA